MSETVTYIGKLIKLYFPEDWDLEKKAKHVVKYLEMSEKSTFVDTWLETLYEDFYEKYAVIKDDIYRLNSLNESDYHGIFHATKNEATGEIDFICQFYNGGCSLGEALEKAIKGIE
jgi:hypothetical protein